MISFPRMNPGEPYPIEEFNRALAILEQIANLVPDPSILTERVGGSTYLAVEKNDPFPAKITGASTCLHSWEEVESSIGSCTLGVLSGGRSGSTSDMPAKDLFGTESITTNTIVWLQLAAARDHYIIVNTATAGSIRTTGDLVVLPAITCLGCDTGGNATGTINFLTIHSDTLTDLAANITSSPPTGYSAQGCIE